jgi:hypothetical protein
MIKGKIEDEIRSSYFGGNVDVYINEINDITGAYYYDMNSQYPYAMLQDMPIGNPTFTTDNNLNNIFGFVYGTIIAPSEEILQVPIIQYRNPRNGSISCPRGSFKRMIFSEEIKSAIKYGYTINIEYGYKFKRGKNVFKEFVDTLYKIKRDASNPVERFTVKLMLNALFGRMGMKEITSKLKILNKIQAQKILKNYNCTIFAELDNDHVLVKYSSRISENIRRMYKLQEEENKNIKFNDIGLSKERGVVSAVHIAVAIASYARMFINEYKNIPGNPCIMSDTDSAVLPYKINDNLVGKEIGQMKLEYIIKNGIFIRKKLYAIKTKDNQTIIKASGAKAKELTFDHFIKLLNGQRVETKILSFYVNWKNMQIVISHKNIKLNGLNHLPKTLFNNPNTNFKAISTPKSYNLILFNKDLSLYSPYSNLPLIKNKSITIFNTIYNINYPNLSFPFKSYFSLIRDIEILINEDKFKFKNYSNFLMRYLYSLIFDNSVYNSKLIINNITNIINKLNNYKVINELKRFRVQFDLYSIQAKMFYLYGTPGRIIKKELIKYLEEIKLISIIQLFLAIDPNKTINSFNIYKRFKINFKNDDLNFLISCKFEEITKIKNNYVLVHKITFIIDKTNVNLPTIIMTNNNLGNVTHPNISVIKKSFKIKTYLLELDHFDYADSDKFKNITKSKLSKLDKLSKLNKLSKLGNLGKRSFSTSAIKFDRNNHNNLNPNFNFNSIDKINNSNSIRLLRLNRYKSLDRNIENYVTDTDEIEDINFEYEKYIINLEKNKLLLKSKILKDKLNMKNGMFMISNKDLEIFRIESESNDHIVLKHIDIDNGYKLIISISKFYPEKYGNYIFYNLSYYEYFPTYDNSFILIKQN